MKKSVALMLAGLLALTLAACGNNNPSLAEVEKAVADGTVTAQDALNKGWVDEAWMDEYNKAQDALSIPAADKTTSNLIGDFETATQSGEPFTKDDLNTVTYFAFINPDTEAGKEAYAVIAETGDAIIEGSGSVLIVNTSGKSSELFAESEFPVVLYNDSVASALGSLTDMVNGDGFSGSWNGGGAFLTAWNSKIDGDSLLGGMTAVVDIVG